MAENRQSTGPVTLSLEGGRRPERADAARNRRILLDTASRIVRDEGVAALSMESVAAAAGVGIGTVYRRFGDRAGLAYALLDEQERDFQAAFISGPPPLGPDAEPAVRLRAYLDRYVDRLAEHAELLATAETHRYQSGAYNVQRRHLAMLINQIDPQLDGPYLADALLAALSGQLYLHQTTEAGMSVERIRAGIAQLLRGIVDG
ncbi:TetR/AcrR family transcriptional regulator [Actinobacteria bacterium YIM 96077]|uniref:TetR family transcriptional regulator n=1 Tax=Phytoactinopolyspora halophila TaxID=1981511 RepID=A0A329QGG3_9ACTN|nr:TetR/AcrR family transcriptional regulator [Phytoactinopolyspora halophila]AYY14485.1 TetR/AcrR family transcriptional regulator [Actinobacteria bacterium YIM 96077]RAW11477.1 TetR family transcriptional regulator [Phytoactinopolyspora halophila]